MQETQQAYRVCHAAQQHGTAAVLLTPAATQRSPARRAPLGRMGKTRTEAGQKAAPQQLEAMGLSPPSGMAMG